jgi:hypothetical protein
MDPGRSVVGRSRSSVTESREAREGKLMSPDISYESTVSTVRRPASSDTADYRELVRLGSLAASSHNTQPWTFGIGDGFIRIVPDFSRRCPVVDPEDAHLYKSLGCAAENIVHAAAAMGLRAEVDIETEQQQPAVIVRLTPDAGCQTTELAAAILTRQCTKAAYSGHPVADEDLATLARAGTADGVRAILLTDADEIRTVTDFVGRGNVIQLSDTGFRNELISWIRSNDRAALASGDGLASRTTGHPSVPSWLAKRLLPRLITAKRQVETDRTNIASSAGVAVFVSGRDDVKGWVDAGRCYERFALQATALDIRNAFINQPIEVDSLRPEFEGWLGLEGERAQLMVRFGRGPIMPYSVRRPLDDVMKRYRAS